MCCRLHRKEQNFRQKKLMAVMKYIIYVIILENVIHCVLSFFCGFSFLCLSLLVGKEALIFA